MQYVPLSEAAARANLSTARIRGLARAKVIASRLVPVAGTKLAVLHIDTISLDEYINTKGTSRKLKYIIDVPGSEIDAVTDFLAARGIAIERRYHKRQLRRQLPTPFDDILQQVDDGDTIDISGLLTEDEIIARLDAYADAEVQQRIKEALDDDE